VRQVQLAFKQARYELLSFSRNPAAAFFTFVFPLMFLVIFTVVFTSDDGIPVPGGKVNNATFYVPGIIALSLVNACYTNIAMTVSIQREKGILKRVHGTPLPSVSYFAGRILQSIAVAMILVGIVLAFGVIFYSVDLPTDKLPAFLLALVVGAGALCALGMSVSTIVPNEDAAPPVVNGTVLPLLFISDVFFSTQNAPDWLTTFASIFPLRHLSIALHQAFNPFLGGSGIAWGHLAIVAVWGVIGVVFAMRRFSWEPHR
jgi:ABC-2 type transport system permease protein